MQLYKLADEQRDFQKDGPVLLLKPAMLNAALPPGSKTDTPPALKPGPSGHLRGRRHGPALATTGSAQRSHHGRLVSARCAGARHLWDAAHGAPVWHHPPGGPGKTTVWLLAVQRGRRAPELPLGLHVLFSQSLSCKAARVREGV